MSDAVAIVVAILGADATNTGIVGKKNFAMKMPQAVTPPCNVVTLVGGSDEQMITGPGNYYEERVRVASISNDPSQAIDLGTAVRAALGAVVKATMAGAKDVDIFFAGGIDETNNDDPRLAARRIQDFTVRYRDA